MDTYLKLGALAQAAVEALVAGAGIALFFALGLRGLAMWAGDDVPALAASVPRSAGRGATVASATRNPAGLVLAVLCFAVVVVVAVVVVGLYVLLTTK